MLEFPMRPLSARNLMPPSGFGHLNNQLLYVLLLMRVQSH